MGCSRGAVKDPGGTNPTTHHSLIRATTSSRVDQVQRDNIMALKAGNAATGPLNTYWNGALPADTAPSSKQGGLSLARAVTARTWAQVPSPKAWLSRLSPATPPTT